MGKLDLRQALSQILGLPPETIDEIWADTQANHGRLEACPGPHEFFRPEPNPERRAWCMRCGGWVGLLEVRWYERGLAHGRKERG